MANIAKLCSTCNDMFRLKDGQKSLIPQDQSDTFRDHHGTLESLLEAVRHKCFICTKSWSYFGKDCQTDWIEDPQSFIPLMCDFGLMHSFAFSKIMVLSICWSSPNLVFATPVTFYLIRVSAGPVFEKSTSVMNQTSETSSILSLGQAYQWYMSCRSCHKQCPRLATKPRWCPTRLLDIGLEGETDWKLKITSVDIHVPPLYMTLSYTWGSSLFFKLEKSNLEECRRGSPINSLPRTFRDMITVARRFSIRYVWIDALCILQDCKNDWEKEASSMRDVYANSICNVAAAASVDPHGGLFRLRHASDIQPGLVWSNAFDAEAQFYHILDEAYWSRQVSDTVLHKRGWVLQERLLPPRTLHFTKHQIFWECSIDQKCEASPCGPPSFIRVKNLRPDFRSQDSKSQGSWRSFLGDSSGAASAIAMWKYIVERYTRCVLTMPNDKMVALSGLAKLYQQATGDIYIAGLWKAHLIEGLAWHILQPSKVTIFEYRAPSWSWAATDGAVGFDLRFEGSHSSSLVRVLDVQIISSLLDPTGQVYGGFIDLEAVVIPATYRNGISRDALCDLKLGGRRVRDVSVYKDSANEGFGDNSEIYCLALRCCHYLLGLGSSAQKLVHLEGIFLRPISDSPNIYTRIGYFEIADEDALEYFGIRVDKETRHVTQDEKISPSRIRIL